MTQYGVAALEKGIIILCGQPLVLNHLLYSELVNIILQEYMIKSLKEGAAIIAGIDHDAYRLESVAISENIHT